MMPQASWMKPLVQGDCRSIAMFKRHRICLLVHPYNITMQTLPTLILSLLILVRAIGFVLITVIAADRFLPLFPRLLYSILIPLLQMASRDNSMDIMSMTIRFKVLKPSVV